MYNWDLAREKMKEIRLSHDMTMMELAIELGWSQSSVGKYEIGQTIPNIDYVIAFCQFFNIKIEDLFRKPKAAEYVAGQMEFKDYPGIMPEEKK